jgi:IS30 family transposase
MPFKTEKTKLDSPFFDRRVKLLPCMREMIHVLHEEGRSITSLARQFNVNKRLIQFELFPERKEKNYQNRLERGGSKIYYKGGEEWAETMRTHRRHKYDVLTQTIQFKNK